MGKVREEVSMNLTRGLTLSFGVSTQEDVCIFGLGFKWGGVFKCGYVAYHMHFINIRLFLFLNRCVCDMEIDDE